MKVQKCNYFTKDSIFLCHFSFLRFEYVNEYVLKTETGSTQTTEHNYTFAIASRRYNSVETVYSSNALKRCKKLNPINVERC